jgi:hypothetical protein
VDPNTLFRGNSLASKGLDHLMKLLCIEQGSYLLETLDTHIQIVYDMKTSCELDPTRIQGAGGWLGKGLLSPSSGSHTHGPTNFMVLCGAGALQRCNASWP